MSLPWSSTSRTSLGRPVFTLDVNQIALKQPGLWTPAMKGLGPLEWNHFRTHQVELCVTPETAFEITQGQALDSMPWTGYLRFKKSQLFTSRPSGTTMSLNEQQANELWQDLRGVLWPNVSDAMLTGKHRADVSQLYFHMIGNSLVTDSAYLTGDRDFLDRADAVHGRFGVVTMTPTEAWTDYRLKYSLHEPSDHELGAFLRQQHQHLLQMSTRSS